MFSPRTETLLLCPLIAIHRFSRFSVGLRNDYFALSPRFLAFFGRSKLKTGVLILIEAVVLSARCKGGDIRMFDVNPLSTAAGKLLAFFLINADEHCRLEMFLSEIAERAGLGRPRLGTYVDELVKAGFIGVLVDGTPHRKCSTFQVLCLEVSDPPEDFLETYVRTHGYAKLDLAGNEELTSHMGWAQPMERDHAQDNRPVRVTPVAATNPRDFLRPCREPRP
jgi:hypothetical protein